MSGRMEKKRDNRGLKTRAEGGKSKKGEKKKLDSMRAAKNQGQEESREETGRPGFRQVAKEGERTNSTGKKKKKTSSISRPGNG